MLKMLALHTTQSLDQWNMDWQMHWKIPRVLQTEVRPLWAHCSSPSAVSTTEAYTNILDVPKGNNQEDTGLVNKWVRKLIPAFLSIAQCMQSTGKSHSITEMGHDNIKHEPCVLSNIQQDSIQ
jgi:hypothetical protein